MTDSTESTPEPSQPPVAPDAWAAGPPQPTHSAQPGWAPVPHQAYAPAVPAYGPIGKVRGTGVCILLTVVTFGIYPLVWWYLVHDELKRHSGAGVGGGIALLLAFLVGIVMPFITSSEIGELYARRGQAKPVSGTTGLWYFPGMFIIVGPIVWFVKTNGAINAYWRSLGAS